MLSLRTEKILKSIVGQYIAKATPVPSHSINEDQDLNVSSATIRNEMAFLEQEGYITRPHPSAGGIPLDKGYRSYVSSLADVQFPVEEQRTVSHLFHQVEQELQQWVQLAATLTAQRVQNITMVSLPRTKASQFKHLELVALQEALALVVLVLRGARVRQQLINTEDKVSQVELTAAANRLSELYGDLTAEQIKKKRTKLSALEQQVTDTLVKLMELEDTQDNEEPYLDGLHYTLNQPEFTGNPLLSQALTELIERRNLLHNILPIKTDITDVQVTIGKENESETVQNYSVVTARYGLRDDASGTICVIGPTRMPYARTIATVGYLSMVLSGMVARLYGIGETEEPKAESA